MSRQQFIMCVPTLEHYYCNINLLFYLDWDPSNYPLLAKIRQSVERFSSLWHLALDFHENYEKWYYGPFKGLDTNIIQTQVETMYSTACQLSKTFNDSPAARRISETVRTKIEKFRTHLPVLHTLVWIFPFKFSHNPLKFSFTRETDIKMTRTKKLNNLQNFKSWKIELTNTPIFPTCQVKNSFLICMYLQLICFWLKLFFVNFYQERKSERIERKYLKHKIRTLVQSWFERQALECYQWSQWSYCKIWW